ncbi:lysophospholipase [Melghirimyces profundicolus]|uniref:Lysophospholipase n=1 Tax=Melghirimyces profundicolus TaxID=1242148 RepID=A0A2T6C9I0_9BACL|nr:alpha/beta fold hydrolase [Melghirimyces profundicolus]PTX64974.1 lysophospholipase [Melghirimyces profundicolus]
MSVKIHEDRLCTWDGIHLRYRIWLPNNPRSVAVLVHGAGEHLGLYKHLGDRFARDGFGLITYDLRGFGCSEGKCGHVTHFYEYLNDLDQLIHVFRQEIGNRRFYLIGHSLGGLIVIRYVQQRPKQVNGLILSAPALGLHFDVPLSVKRLISLFSHMAPSFSVNPYSFIKKAQRIPRVNSIITYNIQSKLRDPLTPLTYSFRWIQEFLIQTGEAMRSVAKVMVPTLCLCGKEDRLIPAEIVRSFFDSLTVKEKEWLLFPDLGHRLLHFEQPASAINALLDWMNRQEPNNSRIIREDPAIRPE